VCSGSCCGVSPVCRVGGYSAGMSEQQKPDAFIIGIPGAPRGPAVLACDDCGGKFSAQLSTAVTVAQVKGTVNQRPVLCYGCLGKRPEFAGARVAGVRESRRLMGLDGEQ
jgi:hypothetical protein